MLRLRRRSRWPRPSRRAPATRGSASPCCCSAPGSAWRRRRPPSRSWARCHASGPGSDRPSTTPTRESAARSAWPSSAASCRRSTAAISPAASPTTLPARRRPPPTTPSAPPFRSAPAWAVGADVADAAREAFVARDVASVDRRRRHRRARRAHRLALPPRPRSATTPRGRCARRRRPGARSHELVSLRAPGPGPGVAYETAMRWRLRVIASSICA